MTDVSIGIVFCRRRAAIRLQYDQRDAGNSIVIWCLLCRMPSICSPLACLEVPSNCVSRCGLYIYWDYLCSIIFTIIYFSNVSHRCQLGSQALKRLVLSLKIWRSCLSWTMWTLALRCFERSQHGCDLALGGLESRVYFVICKLLI